MDAVERDERFLFISVSIVTVLLDSVKFFTKLYNTSSSKSDWQLLKCLLRLGEVGRWGNGEMGRWGDGEMGRWGNGEMGRWGDEGEK
jgi:hypothetical protein